MPLNDNMPQLSNQKSLREKSAYPGIGAPSPYPPSKSYKQDDAVQVRIRNKNNVATN